MKNPFRWHFVELSNDQGAQVWAIRRWRGTFEYMDLDSPHVAWTRSSISFEDCISSNPETVLEVYNERILNRSRVISLEQLRKTVMKYRLRGGK